MDYGHALRAFVEYLIAKGYHTSAELLAELRKRLHTYTQEIASKDSTSPLQRTAEHFALVRLAGELAREAGLLGTKIDPARVVAWAWGAFQESEEAQALDPVARAIEKLTTWIQTEPNKIAPLVSNENEGTGRTGFEGIFAWRGKMEYHWQGRPRRRRH